MYVTLITLSYCKLGDMRILKNNPIYWIKIRFTSLEIPSKNLVIKKLKEYLTEAQSCAINDDLLFKKWPKELGSEFPNNIFQIKLPCDHIGHLSIIKKYE